MVYSPECQADSKEKIPIKISAKKFEILVVQALEELSVFFKDRLENIEVLVADWPTEEELEETGLGSEQNCIYGIIAKVTHAELNRLYAHAKKVLGEVYLPEAVLVETLDGKWQPVLCYICPAMEPRLAANDYVDRIVGPAKEYGFPEWYIQRLERFRP